MSWVIKASPRLSIFDPLREFQEGGTVTVQNKPKNDDYIYGCGIDKRNDMENNNYTGKVVKVLRPQQDDVFFYGETNARIMVVFTEDGRAWNFTPDEIVR